MKRLLYLTIIGVSLFTIFSNDNEYIDDEGFDNLLFEEMCLSFEEDSKEFTAPNPITVQVPTYTTIIPNNSYTLGRRVTHISSHSTNPYLKKWSHRNITYGILRV